MTFNQDNINSIYIETLNYKWDSIEYHLNELYRIQTTQNNLIAIRANFDGILFQLHTTHDIVGQLVNEILQLNMDVGQVDLNKVKNRLIDKETIYPEVFRAIYDLWSRTVYTRDYVNYSKHRNIVRLDSKWAFVSSSMPVQFVIVEPFTKKINHSCGQPWNIAQTEVEKTRELIISVLNSISK